MVPRRSTNSMQHNATQREGLFPTIKITTFSIITHREGHFCDTQHNNTQYFAVCSFLKVVMLNVILLSVITQSNVVLNVVMQSVVKLSVVASTP